MAAAIPPIAIPIFGLLFGAMLVCVGAGRLWDARKQSCVRAALADGAWAAVGICGGLALCIFCGSLLLQGWRR